MSFLLAFKRVNSVGWNRREEQAADELRRTSAKMCFLLCPHLVQGSRFRVQGRGGGFAAFFIGRCPKVIFKSWVTSHNNDTSRPLETEVPQRDFRVWPNPKRRLACPLRRLPVRPNGPRQRRRMDPRSGVKNYVRLSVSLKRHPDRSGGIFLADR